MCQTESALILNIYVQATVMATAQPLSYYHHFYTILYFSRNHVHMMLLNLPDFVPAEETERHQAEQCLPTLFAADPGGLGPGGWQ